MFIVALGRAAGLISDKFSSYPQYSILKIDIDLEDTKNAKQLVKQKTAEDYENHFSVSSFRAFFKQIKSNEEVIFLSVGSADSTGCSLRILEILKEKNRKINILYVRPDLTFLNEKAIQRESLTFNVFQEYARSGIVEKLTIFENILIEKSLGNISISKFYDRINETIASTYHMINVFNHMKPLFEVKSDNESKITRLTTYGLFDPITNEEKIFFPLKYITNKIFYFAFTKKEIEESGQLIQRIKEQMKNRLDENTKINFKVFQTEYTENIAFCECQTHIIQSA